jgi:hypothetical protein
MSLVEEPPDRGGSWSDPNVMGTGGEEGCTLSDAEL